MKPKMLQRPIYGGVFGHGLYCLATMPMVSHGLHAVRFMVIDPRGGAVISAADDKLAAIESARRVLRLTSPQVPDSANVRLQVVAALYAVSTVTVWRWSAAGRLPAPVKMGGVTAWNVGALRRVMSGGTQPAAA